MYVLPVYGRPEMHHYISILHSTVSNLVQPQAQTDFNSVLLSVEHVRVNKNQQESAYFTVSLKKKKGKLLTSSTPQRSVHKASV